MLLFIELLEYQTVPFSYIRQVYKKKESVAFLSAILCSMLRIACLVSIPENGLPDVFSLIFWCVGNILLIKLSCEKGSSFRG